MTTASQVFDSLVATVKASRDKTLLGAAIERIVELENDKATGVGVSTSSVRAGTPPPADGDT